jgi:peptidoglycan/xylan/chitin deacetylase (PgdA/CDA1 family)
MFYLLVGVEVEACNRRTAAPQLEQASEIIAALTVLHTLVRKWRARPTYLVTYSAAKNAHAASMLREMREGRDCEIGAYHQTWDTPPCSDEHVRRRPCARELNPARFAAQVASLTDAIAAAVGERPLSYRSERMGFSASHVFDLERAGYRIESTVARFPHEGHAGGAGFAGAPSTPYFLAYDDPSTPGTSNLLEIPVSAALNRRVPAVLERAYGRMPWPGTTRPLLGRLGLIKVQVLRPFSSTLDDMRALARRMKRDGVPMVNLVLNSSETALGANAGVRSPQELERLLSRLEDVLAYIVNELGAVPVTFSEFRALYCGAQGAPPS